MFKPITLLTLALMVTTACSPSSAPPQSSSSPSTPAPNAAAPANVPGSALQPGAPNGGPGSPGAATSDQLPTTAQTAPPAQTPAAQQTPTAGAPAASATAQPASPVAPRFREVTIPAGTTLSVTLSSSLSSATSKAEDAVHGTLARPVVVSQTTAVPAGAEVTGSVLEATRSGRVKGVASIAFRFDRLTVDDESHRIQTARITRQAAATKGKDARTIGIGAGAGAIIGGIVGGGKGAAIGAGVGGGAGTGAVMATRGKEVEVPDGTMVSVRLTEPVTLRVPIDQQ